MKKRTTYALVGLLVFVLATALPATATETKVVLQQQGGIGVSSFEPGKGSLVAIAFDHVANDLFIYPEHGAEILEYSTSGSQVGAGIPVPPPGSTSNDIDLDFATESLSVGGTSVPSNELLVPNGDGGNILYAIDKDDGTVEAQQQMPPGSVTGGAQHPIRDSFFILSYGENLIKELNANDGTILNSFPIRPEGSPPFSAFYSDIDVDPTTGNILIVSSVQNVVRQISATGEWLGDADVYNEDDPNDPLRIDQMTGVAIDEASRDVWISSRSGKAFRLTNLWDNFSTAVPCEQDPNAICGNEGDDKIQGTSGNDTIYGGGGNDVIDGGGR